MTLGTRLLPDPASSARAIARAVHIAAVGIAALTLAGAAETGIEVEDPRLEELIDPAAEIEVLAEGYRWAEGPVWDAAEQRLIYSDQPNNIAYVWTAEAGAQEFLNPSGHTGWGEPPNPKQDGSNGLTLDADGNLVLCQHGDRRVARLEDDGSFTTLASHYDGKRLNSPNDCALGPNGAIYFTDPFYGLPGGGKSELREQDASAVYRVTTDGEVERLVADIAPNGIAFTPEFARCILVDRRDLRSYRVAEDGSLVDGEVLFSLPEGEKGGWDGLTIDAHGNIFACNWRGGVFVVAPDGTWLGTIRTGGKNANCAFGGEDLGTLFITAGKRLVRVQTKTHGAPHPAQR